MRLKLFRDPVHDIISFDRDDPLEAVLLRLVDASEVQRLRRVRQLGLTFLVFQGAEHSRFTHSMGVCHMAGRIYDQLFPRGSARDPMDRMAVQAAGLLHDVGHGPLSHVLERVSGVHHEETSAAIIRSERSDIHQVLAAVDAGLPERVASLLEKDGAPSILSHIVSSQLDADRLDYILRDGMATGVKIGVFDLERIISMMRAVDGTLAVHERAEEAVEGYLIARFHMYKQVYLHKASRAAEKMLEATVQRARELLRAGHPSRLSLDPTSATGKLVSGVALTAEELVSLDDSDLWFVLKRWSEESDPVLAELAGGLVGRRLYKTIAIHPDDPRGVDNVVREAREAAARAGADPDYQVLVDFGRDHPYTPYQPGMRAQPIHIINNSGHLQQIERRSEVVGLLARLSHEVIRVCVPERFRAAVSKVASLEGAPSLLPR